VLWILNYDEGLDTAKADGTLVLIEFYADWCGRCQDLELETWNNPEIIQYINTKFTCIKIDVDVNSTLRNAFHVTSLPTVVFLTSSGVEVGRIGYGSSSDFMDYAIQIETQFG
jgi:thiol:disulfide interchange protein